MKKNKGFTLVEMLISFTIFAALVISSYIPYSYHQSKAKIKIGSKTVSQVLSESRTLSISGLERYVETSPGNKVLTNVSVGTYFERGEEDIQILSYPFNIIDANIRTFPFDDYSISEEKTLKMPMKVEISEVVWKESGSEQTSNNVLVIFESIKGNAKFYTKNSSGTLNEITPDNEVVIKIGIDGKRSGVLSTQITFNKKTGLIDY